MTLVCHYVASYLPSVSPSSNDPAEARGRARQRRRTRTALLAAAAQLVAAGLAPTVAEVADAADVSRRTAYRYFPSQERLLVEAALEGLRPVVERAMATAFPASANGADPAAAAEARLDAMVRIVHRLALEQEPLLRTVQRLTAGRGAAGQPVRGSRRLDWITEAIAPVRPALGAARHQRLVAGLSLVVGFDALFALRDMHGMPAADVERVTRWSARALLREALAEATDRRTRTIGGRG